jgi:hypothetical protein
METCLVPPLIKKISLPNKKHDQKIDLNKLFTNLKTNESFQASYDKRKNPYQNWVEIIITGKARIFSNGTATTNLMLPDEALIEFFDKLYKAYILDCLKGVDLK